MHELVSIITPTYNRGYILGTAIESVRAQTHSEWEMIIVDDGSSDDTKEVVSSFADDRIKYLKQDNKGPSAARNRALEIARGKWLAFLDSDNELLPSFLTRSLEVLRAHPEVLCIVPKGHRTLELYEGDTLVAVRDGSEDFPQTADVVKEIFMRTFHFDMNGFIHHASIRDEGVRFDERIKGLEDWDYVMTIAEKHPDSFLYLPEALYHYHQRYGGDGLVSNTPYGTWADLYELIYQKHKHDQHMTGQEWYPSRAEKWRKMQADYEKGLVPPPHRYQFEK